MKKATRITTQDDSNAREGGADLRPTLVVRTSFCQGQDWPRSSPGVVSPSTKF